MGKSDLMDRVTTDLSRGHTYPAIQRMHSLVAAHPTDLDLRRRLAAIYRATGNAVEAGRWSYLDDIAEPEELEAFEARYPAHRRLDALRWPTGAPAPTDISRVRLAPLLAAAASAQSPKPNPAEDPVCRPRPPSRHWWHCPHWWSSVPGPRWTGSSSAEPRY
ncbi:DUF6584 family protein [Catellatospora coxensis]